MPRPRPKFFVDFTYHLDEAARQLAKKHPELSFHDAYMMLYRVCEDLEVGAMCLESAFVEWVESVAVPEVETDLLHEATGIERYP